MTPISNPSADRYSSLSMFFHWSLALLVPVQIGMGWYMLSIEDQPGSGWYFDLHMGCNRS